MVLLPAILAAAPAAARERVALSVFHFNVEYVAGDAELEARIITDSLDPLLKVFEAHPTWRADVEIQGYGIALMIDHHPDVLARLKRLVARGQVELIVTHYADQFFIAYPDEDLVRSVAESDAVLARAGLERSRVFSAQEMQWAPWTLRTLDRQYDVFLASSVFGHYHEAPHSLYDGGDGNLVLQTGGDKVLGDTEWTYAFYDDGENWNTFTTVNRFRYAALREQMNVREWQRREDQGWTFSTIGDYLRRVMAAGHRPPPVPPSVEGTWRMGDAGPSLWMGRRLTRHEEDGRVRALAYEARGELLLAEALGASGPALAAGWRHLFHCEVSDSSGWRPEAGEVRYAATHRADVAAAVRRALAAGSPRAIPTPALVETRDGRSSALTAETAARLAGPEPETPAPLAVTLAPPSAGSGHASTGLEQAPARGALTFRQLTPACWALDARIENPGGERFEYELRFPISGPPRGLRRDDGTPYDLPADPRHPYDLPVPNGFVPLGGGWWLVKDCASRHLAGRWDAAGGTLVFREELNDFTKEVALRWYLVQGDEAPAWRLAERLNLWPIYAVARIGDEYRWARLTGGRLLRHLVSNDGAWDSGPARD